LARGLRPLRRNALAWLLSSSLGLPMAVVGCNGVTSRAPLVVSAVASAPGSRKRMASKHSRVRVFRAWLWSRKTELTILLLGVLLRMTMAWNYDVRWGYDANEHWDVVSWIAIHKRVPYPEFTFEAFHPPLYYSLAAWLTTLGVTRANMAGVSIVMSCLELAVIWMGVELYMDHSRLARVAALALAAVVSALIHLGGMVYPEALNCLLNAAVMLFVPLAFRRADSDRWPLTLLIGLLLGAAMLTKISTIAVVVAIALGVAIELFSSGRSLRTRLLNLVPWTGALVVCLAVCGWYYGRNVREYGRPFLTSFDMPSEEGRRSEHSLVEDAERKKFLDRRTLGFLFAWDDSLFIHPFAIWHQGAHDRLVPVAVASTFVDFWGYGFQGFDHPLPAKNRNRAMRDQTETDGLARAAMIGGTGIFVAALVSWFVACARLARDRDFGRLTLVLVPLATLIATFQFATKYPVDGYGVVKGIYMSFGAPPLYGLFGVAVGWGSRTPYRLPLVLFLLAALWCVGAYSIYCRLGIRLLPL